MITFVPPLGEPSSDVTPGPVAASWQRRLHVRGHESPRTELRMSKESDPTNRVTAEATELLETLNCELRILNELETAANECRERIVELVTEIVQGPPEAVQNR